jgi:predicted dehydrogenase
MSRPAKVGVGIIGAGMISDQYLTHLTQYPDVEVLSIADLDTGRAATQASQYGIANSGDVESVFDNDDIEIVVNLTIPAAHVEVSTAAMQAGKHVWSEKPIGIDRDSASGLINLAAERGLLLGIAPDTVLGPAWQTAKRAIQAGVIGKPLSAVTSFQSQGPDWFHPGPEFLFAKGAGPLFDIGPYYLSALVHLLGPISQVIAVGAKAHEVRTIRTGPRAGTEFPVEVPTHINVISTLAGGTTASSLMSTDTALFRHGVFEINGTEGTMVLGDPNYFGGTPIKVYRPLQDITKGLEQDPEIIGEEGKLSGRGVGVLTMARTIRGTDLHVATGELGYHVLDAMVSIEESIERRAFVDIESTVASIPALPADFDPFSATI